MTGLNASTLHHKTGLWMKVRTNIDMRSYASDDILGHIAPDGRTGSRPRSERDIETASLGIGSRMQLPNKAVRSVTTI